MMEVYRIVEQCYNRLPNEWKSHPWDLTEHGRKVLQSEIELDGYLAAYGEMHIVKCRAALQNFPCRNTDDEIRSHNFEVFDWGCGQGNCHSVPINVKCYNMMIIKMISK